MEYCKTVKIGASLKKVNDLTGWHPWGDNEVPSAGFFNSRKQAMAYGAVLFDFDGVIADTENIHIVAWQQTLSRMGWLIPDEAAATAAEVDDRLWLQGLFATKNIKNADIQGWCRIKQETTIRLLESAPSIYPGVISLINQLRGRLRLGVVTTTWRENALTVLEAVGILDAFEFVVAKEDVEAVKPDPSCYLLALDKLQLSPSQVLAVEDSPSGVSACQGAGVPVVVVGHRRASGDWHAHAKAYLPSLMNSQLFLDVTMGGDANATL